MRAVKSKVEAPRRKPIRRRVHAVVHQPPTNKSKPLQDKHARESRRRYYRVSSAAPHEPRIHAVVPLSRRKHRSPLFSRKSKQARTLTLEDENKPLVTETELKMRHQHVSATHAPPCLAFPHKLSCRRPSRRSRGGAPLPSPPSRAWPLPLFRSS